LLAALIQAIISLVLEASVSAFDWFPSNLLTLYRYVFGKFQSGLRENIPPHIAQTRAIPTYLAVFMFAYIYQLFLVWDALRMKNTIQVIGLVLYNAGILLYAGIQYDQINDAIRELVDLRFIVHDDFWFEIKPMLIALPILMGFFTFVFAFLAWKLYDEFAWTIYKHISADLRMKRRYLNYQVCLAAAPILEAED
jgi:hypothetical protein